MDKIELDEKAVKARVHARYREVHCDDMSEEDWLLFEDLYAAATTPAATTSEPVAVKGLTRTDILREWFGGERYARDYEYLDANFGKQAEQIVTYIRSCLTTPPAAPTAIDVAIEALEDADRLVVSSSKPAKNPPLLDVWRCVRSALTSLKATRETA